MKAVSKITNADEMIFAITLTASLKEWRQLREQLSTRTWPSQDVRDAIYSAIQQAEKVFYSQALDAQEPLP